MRRWSGYIVGAAFGVALVATCTSGPPGGAVGLLDGGRMDRLKFDIAGADANPGGTGQFIQATCDKAAVQTQGIGGSTLTNSTYYAEVSVPGLDPTQAPHIAVTLCDYQYFGNSRSPLSPPACPDGWTCTNSGYTPPAKVNCQPGLASLGVDTLLIFCGSRSQSSGASTSDGGSRAQTAYVRVN
jgi:hypothetical protein